MDDTDDLKALADELFGGHVNIPPTYMREVERHLDRATAYLGLVLDSNRRGVYWIDGRSLGVLGCTGIDDKDVDHIGGKILQLDHVTAVDFKVAVHHQGNEQGVTSGRRLTIGDQEGPDLVLDASPGRFLPEKRVQIEQFIDQLLAALAARQ